MQPSLRASFPAYTLPPAAAPAPAPTSPTQLTPMVKITALLSCTPIAGAPVVITAPGRYRLARNLAVAGGNVITIQSDDVTLDLAGFTISSAARPAAGTAITIAGPRRNITIRNGIIRGVGGMQRCGFLFGISGGNPGSSHIRVADVEVIGMGVAGIALSASSPSTLVERCRVRDCSVGIVARTIRDCGLEAGRAA
ncbi:MAG: hypothetical protein JSR82_22485 [Verrucomicrobia bacterium]|nr:hypothetical protein [Verrucomicrobiota bacterium]